MRPLKCSMLLIAAIAQLLSSTLAADAVQGHDVPFAEVLFFGPYSNLAKKYLWQSFIQIWDAMLPAKLNVIAAGRDPEDVGMRKISDMIKGTSCGADVAADSEACQRMKQAFLDSITYANIKTATGYASLGRRLAASASQPGYLGRVTYCSVDTSLVPSMLRQLQEHGGVALGQLAGTAAGTPGGSGASTTPFSRVIVEKPLGNDEKSSRKLIEQLYAELRPSTTSAFAAARAASGTNSSEALLTTDTLLLMDHYLGKTGLKLAYEARRRLARTAEWGAVLNAEAGHLELVFLEDETAEGRTGFYNGVGVVRDMIQSHLSLFLAAAGGPVDLPWSTLHRLGAWANLFPDAITGYYSPYWNYDVPDEVMAGARNNAGGRRRRAPVPAWVRAVGRNLTEALGHTMRFARYSGYTDHVTADRAPGGSGQFSYNVSLARWCYITSKRLAAGQALPAECVGQSSVVEPGPYDLFGPGYRALTGVDFSIEMVNTVLDVRVAKAAGVRTGYFRQYVRTNQPLGCGPLTVTFQMQGRVILPPGINASDPALANLPHDMPAVVITGICPRGTGPKPESLMKGPLGWPEDWKAYSAPSAGVWWFVPEVRPWHSAYISGAADADAATASSVNVSAVTSRLLDVANSPGRAGGDAYTSMIAAAFAGKTEGFSNPVEAEQLWKLWKDVIVISDAGAAGPLVSHAVELQQAVESKAHPTAALADKRLLAADGGETALATTATAVSGVAVQQQLKGLDDYFDAIGVPAIPPTVEHPVGDVSWMRGFKPSAVKLFDQGDLAARASILKQDPVTAKYVGTVFMPPGGRPGKHIGRMMKHGKGPARMVNVDGPTFSRPPENPAGSPYLAVRSSDLKGHSLDKFASDLISIIWYALNQGQPMTGAAHGRQPHIAFDVDIRGLDAGLDGMNRAFSEQGQFEDSQLLARAYERLSEDDAQAILPWSQVQFWTAREADTREGMPRCATRQLMRLLATPAQLNPSFLHAATHPDVSMLNAHARRQLHYGSFDAVVLYFPEFPRGNVTLESVVAGLPPGVAGRPSGDGSQRVADENGDLSDAAERDMRDMERDAQAERDLAAQASGGQGDVALAGGSGPSSHWNWATGDDSSDVFVSTGLNMVDALAGRGDKSAPEPRPYDHMVFGDPALNGMAPLPPPFAGEIDVRLSRAALRSARQVLVLVSRDVVSRYAAAEAAGLDAGKEEGGTLRISVPAQVASDGSVTQGSDSGVMAVPEPVYADGLPGEQPERLPATLARDIQRLAGGRSHLTRVYIV